MNSKAPTIPVLHIRIRVRISFDGIGNLRLRNDDFNSVLFFPFLEIKSNESGEKQSQPIFRFFLNSQFPCICLPRFVWYGCVCWMLLCKALYRNEKKVNIMYFRGRKLEI